MWNGGFFTPGLVASSADTATALVPPDAMRQVSYSGTPRGPDGTTTPDDYTRDMANPVKRMEIFEEMGGGDDQVPTAIGARRQEMCSANWQLSTEDTTPGGQEILAFAEDAIYPHIDRILRLLAGGGLQYGFGLIEPVFGWSDAPVVSTITRGKLRRAAKTGERRIWLRKIAHVRQTSVETFKISATGDLEAIVQHAYNGASFRRVEIAPDKVVQWTYNQQGDDFWGVPPTRHCYKAWTFKTQLERLNVLHIDRFGAGVPVVEEGLGWQEGDRTRLAAYLKAFRSSDSSYIIHPNGGSVSLLTGDGTIAMSALEWVRYYNLAIAKVFLTQQTELGSTETGARALAETMYEQLGSIVQADCEDLANLINNLLIVPLIRWNFGEQESYPTFAPSQRVAAGSGVATVIASLIGQGVIHPRPEDEAYFRDVFELPAVELKVLKAEQGERDAQAAAIKAATPANPADPTKPGGKTPADSVPAEDKALDASRRGVLELTAITGLADGAPSPAQWGVSTWRTPDYSAWEHGIVRPDVLSRELDLHSGRLTGEVQEVLRAIDDELARQVETIAGKGASALQQAVRTIAVPDRLRSQLRKVMLTAATRARVFGGQTVLNEIDRMTGPSAIGPQRAPGFFRAAFDRLMALAAIQDEQTTADLHLLAEVDRAVEEEIDRREQAARSGVLVAIAQAAGSAGLPAVAATAVKSGLLGLSSGRTQDNVEGVVNVGFGIGRGETAQSIANGGDAAGNPINLVAKVYSAVMDLGTCDECAKYDAAQFPIDYPEDYTGVQAPNPRCEGSYKRCRCVWVYVTDIESVPLVPASKGPLPTAA